MRDGTGGSDAPRGRGLRVCEYMRSVLVISTTSEGFGWQCGWEGVENVRTFTTTSCPLPGKRYCGNQAELDS